MKEMRSEVHREREGFLVEVLVMLLLLLLLLLPPFHDDGEGADSLPLLADSQCWSSMCPKMLWLGGRTWHWKGEDEEGKEV